MALNHHDTLVAVHAFIACLAVLFIIPLALLVARFKRHKSPRWVRVHAVLNIWAAIFIIIAFGLGLASVMLNPPEAPPDKNDVTEETVDPDATSGRRRRHDVTLLARIVRKWANERHDDGDGDNDAPDNSGDDSQFIGPEATFHHKMGLVLFILICMQVAWGFTTHYLAHSQERKKRKKRAHSSTIGDDGRSITPVSSDDESEEGPTRARNRNQPPPKRHWTQYTHMVFGIALLILFYIQCWNGLHTEWPNMSENGDPVPTAILVIFWVLVAAPIGPYCLHALSVMLHKGRTPIKADKGAATGLSTNDNVRMTERIVVGGPSSTAAVREQQQEGVGGQVPAYPTYVDENVPLGQGSSRGSRILPDRNLSRGSI